MAPNYFHLRSDILLGDVDFVAETEGHSLALGANSNVAGDRSGFAATERLLHAHVGQSVLAEDRPGVQIRGQEAAIALDGKKVG